jgi:hypothetical protein
MVPDNESGHEFLSGRGDAAPGYAGPPAALRSRLLSRRAALAGVAPVGALAGLGVTRAASLADKVTASQPAKPAPGQGLNVRSFGAKGDGTADDAPAFQAALNQARSSGIGLVIVPPGTYNINATLTAQAPIRITGLTGWSDTTVVFASALATGILFGQPTTAVVYPGPAMQLTDIGIEYGGTGNAVQFNESGLSSPFQDTMVNGCRFYLTGSGVGLYTVNQRDAIITNCQFLGPGSAEGVGIQLSDSDNTKIVDNVFYNLMYGVYGYRAANRVFDAGCLIVSNSMYGFTDALHFEGWELVQAIGNIVDGANNNCFYLLDCYHSMIADNYLGVNGTASGLLIETQQPYGVGFLGQITFRGNYINHYAGASGQAAIAVYGASATLPEDQVLIDGNIVNAYPQYGVQLRNAQNVMVTNNCFSAAATGSVTVYDETPGKNHILNNIVDGSIEASGDTVSSNFPLYSYPT